MKLLKILLEAGQGKDGLAGWQNKAGIGLDRAALAYDSSQCKDKTRLKQRVTEVLLDFGQEKKKAIAKSLDQNRDSILTALFSSDNNHLPPHMHEQSPRSSILLITPLQSNPLRLHRQHDFDYFKNMINLMNEKVKLISHQMWWS
ncbi:hypothetical protein PPACK8108_LOCUS1673 [Phakopsora pachyrhizi]|uniref:Uncharacterized protein n=1 Tax=Phakopsora pachyrhizi TaxID=170000 RepID=A0AAV0AJC8_PHAPC|nr:hypothetical protein PPACK8108_LOCUS1673 [Phakopsora pachyrhizi]